MSSLLFCCFCSLSIEVFRLEISLPRVDKADWVSRNPRLAEAMIFSCACNCCCKEPRCCFCCLTLFSFSAMLCWRVLSWSLLSSAWAAKGGISNEAQSKSVDAGIPEVAFSLVERRFLNALKLMILLNLFPACRPWMIDNLAVLRVIVTLINRLMHKQKRRIHSRRYALSTRFSAGLFYDK